MTLDVGFETPSAFIHAFRMTTGVTPGKYICDFYYWVNTGLKNWGN